MKLDYNIIQNDLNDGSVSKAIEIHTLGHEFGSSKLTLKKQTNKTRYYNASISKPEAPAWRWEL